MTATIAAAAAAPTAAAAAAGADVSAVWLESATTDIYPEQLETRGTQFLYVIGWYP